MLMMVKSFTVFLLITAFDQAFGQFEGLVTTGGPLTPAQKQMILERHNFHRRAAQAANMLLMQYDEEIEPYAQWAADQCKFNHTAEETRPILLSDGTGWIGENIYVIHAQTFEVVDAEFNWWNEISDYTYGSRMCTEGKMCGHYTQVVWANTDSLGCAVSHCDSIEGWNGKSGFLVFCQYAPGGNIEGEWPFLKGEPCSQCPSSHPYCDNGLCSKEQSTAEAAAAPVTAVDADHLCQKRMNTDQAYFCAGHSFYGEEGPGGSSICKPHAVKCSDSYISDFCCVKDPVDGLVCGVGMVCKDGECVDDPTDQTNDLQAGCLYGDQKFFMFNGEGHTCESYLAKGADGVIMNRHMCGSNDFISKACCATCAKLYIDKEDCEFGANDPSFCKSAAAGMSQWLCMMKMMPDYKNMCCDYVCSNGVATLGAEEAALEV